MPSFANFLLSAEPCRAVCDARAPIVLTIRVFSSQRYLEAQREAARLEALSDVAALSPSALRVISRPSSALSPAELRDSLVTPLRAGCSGSPES